MHRRLAIVQSDPGCDFSAVMRETYGCLNKLKQLTRATGPVHQAQLPPGRAAARLQPQLELRRQRRRRARARTGPRWTAPRGASLLHARAAVLCQLFAEAKGLAHGAAVCLYCCRRGALGCRAGPRLWSCGALHVKVVLLS